MKFFKQSGLQNKLTKSLKVSVDTQWHSLFTMLKSPADLFNEVKELLSKRIDEGKLIEIPQECLLKLISFLEILKCALDEIEASKCPTHFLVIIWYNHLLQHLEITEDDEHSFHDLKSSCCEIFKETFEINKYHKMANFLHLKMKSLKILDQPADIESVHEEINDLMSNYNKKRKDENMFITERKAVAYNESRKIINSKNSAKNWNKTFLISRIWIKVT